MFESKRSKELRNDPEAMRRLREASDRAKSSVPEGAQTRPDPVVRRRTLPRTLAGAPFGLVGAAVTGLFWRKREAERR
jgi:hypothetical protein